MKTKRKELEIGNTINLKTPVTLHKNGEGTTIAIKEYYVLKFLKDYDKMMIFSVHFNREKGDSSSASNGDKVRINKDELELLGYEIINPEKP